MSVYETWKDKEMIKDFALYIFFISCILVCSCDSLETPLRKPFNVKCKVEEKKKRGNFKTSVVLMA